MKVIASAEAFDGSSSVAALGMFDGVHIGHQALIRRAVTLAKASNAVSVVCTFDRHPLELLKPGYAPEPLFTQAENLSRFERLGADYALILPFTRTLASMPPEAFAETLTRGLRAKALVCGENYTFGSGGRGSASLLRAMAETLGCDVEIVPAVLDEGEVVSSTLIRRLLKSGCKERAERLLEL